MAELALNIVVEELRNILTLEKKMEYLTTKLELLNSKQVDMQIELQEAELYRGKKRKREVENWLNNVDEKCRQCQALDQEVRKTRAYHVISRRRLAKQVAKRVAEVIELVEQGRCFDGLVLDDTSEKQNTSLVTSTIGKGLEFENNYNKILQWVMDDGVFSIGIYGMGGVGKTTLAMHIYNNLLLNDEFRGSAYWVTVSQEFAVSKLQDDIAQAMDIDLSDENDEKKRAGKLFGALKKRQKCVLILDDVWNQFDAEKVGIHCGPKGCKLLMTSRLKSVCDRFGCEKLIKVEPLLESDAWNLFKEEIGDIELSREAIEIAHKVARRCGGLPLGVVTMARSMRGVTDIHDWRDALEELKDSFKGLNNMENEVLPILLCSFNRLRDPKLQQCFLYCTLYPEDFEVPKCELVNKFISEDLIDGRTSRRAEFDQGHAILNKLENACLLTRNQGYALDSRVKMHDLIRDMAHWITRKHPRFMVKAGLQLKEIPLDQNWTEDLNKVSLMHNKISLILPGTSPKCPRLSSLYMNSNPLVSIPDSFFAHMHSLEILNLSDTMIEKLPDSVYDLVNLKALLLRECTKLVSLSYLGKLKMLRELDLSYTGINEVVRGLEMLTNLKSLLLCDFSVKMIPYGTLGKLLNLQCLFLGEDVDFTDVEGLGHLEEFHATFNDFDGYHKFIKSRHCNEQPCFYDIRLGKSMDSVLPAYFEQDTGILERKVITVCNCNIKEIGRDNEIVLLPSDIRELSLENCGDIECILRMVVHHKEEKSRWSPLRQIEILDLHDLPKFTGIIKWEVGAVTATPPGTFSRLVKLTITKCSSIKKFLCLCLLDNLRNLEGLYVSDCEQMEEIIGDDEGLKSNISNQVRVTLPKLQILLLENLPRLKSICKATMICDSISTLMINNCKKLKKVPLFLRHQQSPPPSLAKISITEEERDWWASLEWEHPQHNKILQPFVEYDYMLFRIQFETKMPNTNPSAW